MEVTDAIVAHPYVDTDKEYIYTFKLEGVEYAANSKRYFEILKPLLLAGPAWTFIRKYNKDNDGHGAIIALCAQADGTNMTKLSISAAYYEIAVARYRGTSRNFTLDDYIGKHSDAHAELLDLKEVISESRKVDDFLKGVL